MSASPTYYSQTWSGCPAHRRMLAGCRWRHKRWSSVVATLFAVGRPSAKVPRRAGGTACSGAFGRGWKTARNQNAFCRIAGGCTQWDARRRGSLLKSGAGSSERPRGLDVCCNWATAGDCATAIRILGKNFFPTARSTSSALPRHWAHKSWQPQSPWQPALPSFSHPQPPFSPAPSHSHDRASSSGHLSEPDRTQSSRAVIRFGGTSSAPRQVGQQQRHEPSSGGWIGTHGRPQFVEGEHSDMILNLSVRGVLFRNVGDNDRRQEPPEGGAMDGPTRDECVLLHRYQRARKRRL